MTTLKDAITSVLGVKSVPYTDEWPGMCPSPDHKARHPTASFNVKKGKWVCYSCGRGGDVLDLLDGKPISDPTPNALIEEMESNLDESQTRVFPEAWLRLYQVEHPYWATRFSADAVAEFGLGYDYQTDRVTYPLRAEDGTVLGVVRRSLAAGDEPKYKYPKGVKTHDLLFGWDKWRPEHEAVVLVEGALDVVALWEAGVPALGIYGSRLSDRQARCVRMLYPRCVVSAYDMDQAGHEAHARTVDLLGDVCTVLRAEWDPAEAKDVAELSVVRRRQVIEEALAL